MNNFKIFFIVCLLINISLINNASSQSNNQRESGKVALKGNMKKTFDSCGDFPSTLSQRMRVRWNLFVSFIIRDRTENRAQSAGGIIRNSVSARQAFLLTSGNFVELGYNIEEFYSSKPKRLVTKYYTFFNNRGSFICQVTYKGRLGLTVIN